MTTIPASRLFRITNPRCPTCGATLRVRILAIVPEKDSFIADQIDVQCEGLVPWSEIQAENWATKHALNGNKLGAIRTTLLQWINSRYRITPTARTTEPTTVPATV